MLLLRCMMEKKSFFLLILFPSWPYSAEEQGGGVPFPCTPIQGLAGGTGAVAGARHPVRGGERPFLGLCLTPQRWQRWAAVSWARPTTAHQASPRSAAPSFSWSLSSIISLPISRTVKPIWGKIYFPLTPKFFRVFLQHSVQGAQSRACQHVFHSSCFVTQCRSLLCYHLFLVSSAVLKPVSRLLDQP